MHSFESGRTVTGETLGRCHASLEELLQIDVWKPRVMVVSSSSNGEQMALETHQVSVIFFNFLSHLSIARYGSTF